MAKYYISLATGDDTRTALQAQNKATPWKHHPDSSLATSTCAAMKSSFAAGDEIIMSLGESWYNTKFVTWRAGTVSNPVVTRTEADFGVGDDDPLIAAGVLATGPWELVTRNEYKTSFATVTTCVFWGDTRLVSGTAGSLAVGKFAHSSGYLHVNIGGNPTGEIILAAIGRALALNNNYRWYKDLAFACSNDTVGGVVYVVSATGARLEGGSIQKALQYGMRGVSDISSEIIGVTHIGNGADMSGFLIGGTGCVVDGVVINEFTTTTGGSGAVIVSGNTNTVKNCVIDESGNIGISVTGNGNIVEKNNISDCWNKALYGATGFGRAILVLGNGSGNTIRKNISTRCYEGIFEAVTGGTGANLYHHNIVDRSLINSIGVWTAFSGVTIPKFYNNLIIHRPDKTATVTGTYTGHAINSRDSSRGIDAKNNIVVLPPSVDGLPYGTQFVEITCSTGIIPEIDIDNNAYLDLSNGTAFGQWATPNGTGASYHDTLAAYRAALNASAQVTVVSDDEHSFFSDEEQFIGAGYSLLPTSACVCAGVDVGLTSDADGAVVPGAAGYDIGPYSYMPGWTLFDGTMPDLSLAATAPGKLLEVQEWTRSDVTKGEMP